MKMKSHVELSTQVLEAALSGLQAQKERVEGYILEVQSAIQGQGQPQKSAARATQASEPERKRRIISAAAKKRIALAQKKRWAEFHAKKKAEVPEAPVAEPSRKEAKPKRGSKKANKA